MKKENLNLNGNLTSQDSKWDFKKTIWVAVIGLLGAVIVAFFNNLDKISQNSPNESNINAKPRKETVSNVIRFDCVEFNDRDKYLEKQLDLERVANEIVFVTKGLSNSFFTDDFFQKLLTLM